MTHLSCTLITLSSSGSTRPQAHSNLVEGLKFYKGGYSPQGIALIEDSKSYRNYVNGVRLHTNKNLLFKGLLLADNGIGISSFDNVGQNEFEDVHVIGLTEKARQLWVTNDLGEMLVVRLTHRINCQGYQFSPICCCHVIRTLTPQLMTK